MDESGKNGSAAALLGRLIRSYRDDYRPNGRRLSQDGLLDLMAERGESYAANLDRSSLSHWERGARLAPREFLVALGRALNIPQPEVDTMLGLAGYEYLGDSEGQHAILEAARRTEHKVETLRRDVRGLTDSMTMPEPSVDAPAVVKGALVRLAPPAVWILAAGLYLNAMGMNETLALLAYLLIALAIALGHGLLRWLNRDPERDERERVVDLFFVSLFFTLSAPGLIGTLTKADHFGFYTIEPYTNTPIPFLLAMLVNLQLALVASVMFSMLWSRRRRGNRGEGALSRAVWLTLPPLAFVFANVVLFTNLGACVFFLTTFGVLFAAFTILAALNESEMALRNVSLVFKAVIAAIALISIFGFIEAFEEFSEPGTALESAEVRIIPLRVITAEQLGYTPDEGVRLMAQGLLWTLVATTLYLVGVVGGYLALAIRRVSEVRPYPPDDVMANLGRKLGARGKADGSPTEQFPH